jgi:hypothetical protein
MVFLAFYFFVCLLEQWRCQACMFKVERIERKELCRKTLTVHERASGNPAMPAAPKDTLSCVFFLFWNALHSERKPVRAKVCTFFIGIFRPNIAEIGNQVK